MNYTTFKSRHERQGIPAFKDAEGKKRFMSFERHTILVPEDDTQLKEVLEGIMEREKKYKLQRTIFTPEEFLELTNPDMAYLETKKGKIPMKQVYQMIDFAYEKGFTAPDKIETRKSKVEQGTKFTTNQEKEHK